MRWLRYRGLLVVVLWQAPLGVTARDENGRTRLAFGFGGGQYEYTSFDCDGNLTDASPVGFTTGGFALEHWVEPRLRVSAHGGVIRDDMLRFDGGYGGVQFAYEGGGFGIGAGPTRFPDDPETVTLPNFYLRIGGRENGHFRLDVLPPVPVLGATPLARMGLGFNQGRTREVGGFAGLSLCGLDCPSADGRARIGFTAELSVPVTSRFALLAGGLWAPGEVHTNASGFVGGQLELGRRPWGADTRR